MSKDRTVTACLIIIGNEILSGRTRDANLSYLAKWLNEEVGIQMREARVIPDIEDTIVDTVNECRAKFDYVFTTGGIGPTHDDITTEAVAKAFGIEHDLLPEAHEVLKEYYGPEGLTSARARMAYGPVGSTLIDNPISKAPGFQVENVFIMAGIPQIMQVMCDSLKHSLTGGKPVKSRSIRTELPESRIAKVLTELDQQYEHVDIGSYPFFNNGKAGTSLVVRTTEEDLLIEVSDIIYQSAFELGGNPVFEEVD
jgi:molybdenum cofactor synthesis domain-containing protein